MGVHRHTYAHRETQAGRCLYTSTRTRAPGALTKELRLSYPHFLLRPYPSDFFFMAGTISVSMSTLRSNFKVKHSLLGS